MRFVIFIIIIFSNIVLSQKLKLQNKLVEEIEFVGLINYTPHEILDLLKNQFGDDFINNDLFKIYCNSEFSNAHLPFSSINVVSNILPNKKLSIIIIVVEDIAPQQIYSFSLPIESLKDIENWESLKNFHNEGFTVSLPIQFATKLFFLPEKSKDTVVFQVTTELKKMGLKVDTSYFHHFYRSIKSFNRISDCNLAIQVLQSDRNPVNRKSALLVLMNFLTEADLLKYCFNEIAVNNTQKGNEQMLAYCIIESAIRFGSQIPRESCFEAIKSILNGGNINYYEKIISLLSVINNPDKEIIDLVLTSNKTLLISFLKSENYSQSIRGYLEKVTKKIFLSTQDCIDFIKSY